VSQQKFDLLEIPAVFAAQLMRWSAASTPLHLGYKRCTEEVPMQIHTNGVDLGKTVFHLVQRSPEGVRQDTNAQRCPSSTSISPQAGSPPLTQYIGSIWRRA
jgi:hypothetical protein